MMSSERKRLEINGINAVIVPEMNLFTEIHKLFKFVRIRSSIVCRGIAVFFPNFA